MGVGFHTAVVLAACALLAACERPAGPPDTRTLGGAAQARPAAGFVEVAGRQVSAPPAPRHVRPQLAAVEPDTTLALWIEDGTVMASIHHPARGWETPVALESIGGDASDARLAANNQGVAMAVWRHSVGAIDSLRYARYESRTGWSTPDVLPGALPRPRQPGKTVGRTVDQAAPHVEIDAQGHARAQWQSGFNEGQVQVSTYVAGEGWSRPLDVPMAAAR